MRLRKNDKDSGNSQVSHFESKLPYPHLIHKSNKDYMQINTQPKVVMFTTPTCSFCNNAKRYFREKSIRFTEVDVSRDSNAAIDMQRRTGQMGVPVILINNRPIIGFDIQKINSILNIK